MQRIDNTVTDQHRSGLAPTARARDTRPPAPADYDPANVADARHGIFGAGRNEAAPERADALNTFIEKDGEQPECSRNNCLLVAI